MHTLRLHQRVKVLRTADGIAVGAPGAVARMRRDGGAWIALDLRHKAPGVHPFEEDDDRGTHVMAYPEDCEPARGTAAERRKAKRLVDGPVPISEFGSDHWRAFGYIVAISLDGGKPDRRRMRCDPARHPHLAVLGQHDRGTYPTQLRGEKPRDNHDDWDCLEDLLHAGLLDSTGDLQEPAYALTEAALPVVRALAEHKNDSGSFSTFEWPRKVASDSTALVDS